MEVVRAIEKCGDSRGNPSTSVVVTGCGLVSRASHTERDLSGRNSKWLRRRLEELRRMKKEINQPTIINIKEHENVMI